MNGVGCCERVYYKQEKLFEKMGYGHCFAWDVWKFLSMISVRAIIFKVEELQRVKFCHFNCCGAVECLDIYENILFGSESYEWMKMAPIFCLLKNCLSEYDCRFYGNYYRYKRVAGLKLMNNN